MFFDISGMNDRQRLELFTEVEFTISYEHKPSGMRWGQFRQFIADMTIIGWL